MKNQLIFLSIIFVLIFITCEKSERNNKEITIVHADTVIRKKIGEPKKYHKIPKNTIWGGHLDGGFWFELVKKYDKHKYRFRIYNENNGDLVLDADFTISDNKNKIDVKSLKDINNISFMYRNMNINGVELKPISPAYGGYYWEIAKEKGF